MADLMTQTTPPPPVGFVRGCHMVAPEHALGNINKRRLKVTRFSDADDLQQDFVTPVTYKDARIELEPGDDDPLAQMSPELEAQLRCSKSDEWSYEEELRKFVPLSEAIKEGPLHFWPFEPRIRLVQVILGHRCELDLSDVRSAVVRCAAAATVTECFQRVVDLANVTSVDPP